MGLILVNGTGRGQMMCPSAVGIARSRPESYRARNQGLRKTIEAALVWSRQAPKQSARPKGMPPNKEASSWALKSGQVSLRAAMMGG